MAKSAKGRTPQARKFGRAAKAARAACKKEPGKSYFECIGEQMSKRLKSDTSKKKRRKSRRK